MIEDEPGPSSQLEETDIFDVEEESTDNSEENELKIKWIESISSKDASDLHYYLNELINQFNKRNGYTGSLVCQFKRYMSCNGVSVPVTWKHRANTLERRFVPTKSANDRGNLAILLRHLSRTIGEINMVNHLSQQLTRAVGLPGHVQRTNYSSVPTDYLSLWHVYRQNYIRGIENILESNVFLRNFENYRLDRNMLHKALMDYRYDHRKFIFMTQATYAAIQVVIQNKRTPLKFCGEQLVQLAHSHVVQLRHKKFQSDVLAHLNEILICAICLNLPKVQQELIEFESFIKQKTPRFLIPWASWQILSRYESAIEYQNSFSFLMVAQRLAESVDNEEIGIEGTVFVEEACKIWFKGGQNEKDIRDLIIDYNQKYPALGPRMVELVKYCNLGYEADSLVDDMCNDNQLHASEGLWLDWVEKRLKYPGRFGAVESTIERCLKATFEYLDFAGNRFSSRAWSLLHDALQKASPSMVSKEWEKRCDWWPKFHLQKPRNRQLINKDFNREAKKNKKEVLAALIDSSIGVESKDLKQNFSIKN